MDNIILKNISFDRNIVFYHFEVSDALKPYFKSDVMFCEFPENLSDLPKSILSAAFVGSFLGLAWLTNSSFWVPELDESYYHSIFNVKRGFQEMFYDASLKGRLVPSKIVKNTLGKGSENKSLLLFGGGVDAHCTFVRHIDQIQDLCNIQGWFEQNLDLKDTPASLADKEHCELVAEQNNKNFCYVRSNFASIVNVSLINKLCRTQKLHDNWWHGLQHSMAFISIALLYAYKKQLANIYIGSSLTVGNNRPCASFITTDSEFKFATSGGVVHDAFELSRQEKVKVLVQHQKQINKDYPLKVCSFNSCNCCRCEKCFRTIIEIVSEGGDVRKFGFPIEGKLKPFFEKVFRERLALWGIEKELSVYGEVAFSRMKENYNTIEDKEFVDWITTYDFLGKKKLYLRNYYRNNFSSILKRKLK